VRRSTRIKAAPEVPTRRSTDTKPETKRPTPKAIVLLGAQRFDPTLGEAMEELRIKGKVATITAGWQEREDDDEDLREHCRGRAENLRLHARAESIFAGDPVFSDAHRERQALLRHRQDFYRIRLEHALDAERVVKSRKAPPQILEDEAAASILDIRDLDAMHLERCARDRRTFEERWRPKERPAVARARAEIASIVADSEAIAIAGGHVASLLNRLSLFGIDEMVEGKVLFAWCAGAMALSDRVVLFHDSPPQGPGAAEVLDAGLGVATGIVVLPQPEARLRLDDAARVELMARRFSPATCVALPARSRVSWGAGFPKSGHGAIELRVDGSHGSIAPRPKESRP
jgi:hypothetical protein